MGWLNNLLGQKQIPAPSPPRISAADIAVAADMSKVSTTFADRNITFKGRLAGYKYDEILRDKQKHMIQLYELSDYYIDAEPLYRGIIKEVYAPFCVADGFRLVGASERVKRKYMEYYERINLKAVMNSVFLSYFKYANVFCYLMPDGRIITLPVHLCRIANVAVNGEPVVEFNAMSVRNELIRRGKVTYKKWLEDEDLDVRLSGYPAEVTAAIKDKNATWVQLDPANTFVLQDLKEDWMRYAVPMIAACLRALEKKERISNYEDSLIDLAARSFVHVTYGDPDGQVLPDTDALMRIAQTFKSAMTGSALAVTNNWAEAKILQPKTDDVFAYDKYEAVNR